MKDGETNDKMATETSRTANGAAAKPSLIKRCFPWIACFLVMSAIAEVASYMDSAVMSGRLTGIPYVLLLVLFQCIFIANWYIYRNDAKDGP